MIYNGKPKSKQSDANAEAFISGADKPRTPSSAPASPKSKAPKKPVALRFDGDLLERIDAAARDRGISRNAWISYQCVEALKNE